MLIGLPIDNNALQFRMFKCVLQQTMQLQFSADFFPGDNYRDVIATYFNTKTKQATIRNT